MSPDHLDISFPPLEGFCSPRLLNCFGIEEFLLVFFIGLGAIAFVCQLVPGILLFTSIVRSLISCIRPNMKPSSEGVE